MFMVISKLKKLGFMTMILSINIASCGPAPSNQIKTIKVDSNWQATGKVLIGESYSEWNYTSISGSTLQVSLFSLPPKDEDTTEAISSIKDSYENLKVKAPKLTKNWEIGSVGIKMFLVKNSVTSTSESAISLIEFPKHFAQLTITGKQIPEQDLLSVANNTAEMFVKENGRSLSQ